MLDPDGDRSLHGTRQAIGPLDGGDPVFESQIVQTEIVHFHRREAIEIDVVELKASAAVFVDQGEGGTADLERIDTEPGGHAADERRFPGAEIAGQQHNRARDRVSAASAAPGGDRLGF